ncbi:hypothetical protein [Kitasatospora sp. NPDC093558]|uniref:hypothetical protein n=1 Tax=Kitasatospora sp. NPDC093558 TaxID=3155201 RepID=UPI0034475D75
MGMRKRGRVAGAVSAGLMLVGAAGVQFIGAGTAQAMPPCYRQWTGSSGSTMCPTYDVSRVVISCVNAGVAYTVEGPWVNRGDFSFARCNSGDGLQQATNPPSVWWEEG